MSYEKTCVVCGAGYDAQQPNAKFCSKRCYKDNKNSQRRKWYKDNVILTRDKVACRSCGKEFIPRDGNNTAFCSRECYIYWNNNTSESQHLSRRKYSYKKHYGITIEDYDRMSEEQNHVCYICGGKQERADNAMLCVDHDHETGKARGLLCHNCNHGIGLFKDDPVILNKAIEYLAKHKGELKND